MRNLRICIYGGTNLQGSSPEFTSELVFTILESFSGCVIITGGFLNSNKKPHAISTDSAALEGAKRYAKKNNVELKECFEAWIPDPSLDERPDVKGVNRMSENQGVNVRVVKGRTPLGRRLVMVAGVDLVLTVSGKRHTEVVAEQAIELGIPVLPIPNFGGDSKKMFVNYQERIATAFGPNELKLCHKELLKLINIDVKKAANAVVNLIRTAKLGKCLILLPYDVQHNKLYNSIIEPLVAEYMIPIRLDQLPGSQEIYTSFADAIRSSLAVIVDITELNENVMYEVGYACGLGLEPLIYTRNSNRLKELPIYFRTLNVKVTNEEEMRDIIRDYLKLIKKKNSFQKIS